MESKIKTGWIELKEGNPLPDYDEPALWLYEDGSVHVDILDKDESPDISYKVFNEDRVIKCTHWHKMPSLP